MALAVKPEHEASNLMTFAEIEARCRHLEARVGVLEGLLRECRDAVKRRKGLTARIDDALASSGTAEGASDAST